MADANALIQDMERRMEGALTAFHNDMKGLRTGRASTSLLDVVKVEAYGDYMPISQLGTVSAPDAAMLSVQVWDQSLVATVEKAINNAGLGLNAMSDGTLIRVPIPKLSEERRKEMVKAAAKYAEEKRIAVRNIRRDGMDDIKKLHKDKHISEDEQHGFNDKIQKLTDKYVAQIDELLAHKEKDILTV